MGWVTLAIRKQELRATHTELQSDLLTITREKRQMTRSYALDQLYLKNDKSSELSDLKNYYAPVIADYRDRARTLRNSITVDMSEADKQKIQKEIDEINNTVKRLMEERQAQADEIKAYFEDQLGALEAEAKEEEEAYDNDKTKVETEMEAVSQELQAVSEAISQEIQNTKPSFK